MASYQLGRCVNCDWARGAAAALPPSPILEPGVTATVTSPPVVPQTASMLPDIPERYRWCVTAGIIAALVLTGVVYYARA